MTFPDRVFELAAASEQEARALGERFYAERTGRAVSAEAAVRVLLPPAEGD